MRDGPVFVTQRATAVTELSLAGRETSATTMPPAPWDEPERCFKVLGASSSDQANLPPFRHISKPAPRASYCHCVALLRR